MAKIMTDSSCTMTVAEGAALGIIVNPLNITIAGGNYIDQETMQTEQFLALIAQGNLPTSSQPSVGTTLDLYHQHANEELLNITMADGLSGTYQTATGAVQMLDPAHQAKVHVVNTTTLWAPQGYLVRKAAQMAKDGLPVQTIIEKIRPSMESAQSFLIPSDFDYLRRGGRLTPMAAHIGGLLKLVPVLKQTPDGRRLEKHALCRNMKTAIESSIKGLHALHVDEKSHLLCVSHAGAPELAQQAIDLLRKSFPLAEITVHSLSPAMITQGGPRCLAVQSILKLHYQPAQ